MKKRLKSEFSVLAGLLVLSGIALFFEDAGFLRGIHKLWPVFVFVVGLGLVLMFCQSKKDFGLIGIGSFMIMLSIFFFYLNFTSWIQLKDLWPIFISILSISILLCYAYNKKRIFLIIGISGILLSAAFILIFGVSTSLWPVSLIIVGLFIYIISLFDKK